MNTFQSRQMELNQKHQHSCFNCGYQYSTHHIERTELHINGHDMIVLHEVSLCESDWQHYQKCKDADESRFLFSSKMVCVDDGNVEQVNTYKHSYLSNRTVMH